MAESRTGAEVHKMSLGHLAVPESKEVFERNKPILTMMGVCQRTEKNVLDNIN